VDASPSYRNSDKVLVDEASKQWLGHSLRRDRRAKAAVALPAAALPAAALPAAALPPATEGSSKDTEQANGDGNDKFDERLDNLLAEDDDDNDSDIDLD